MTFDQSKMSDQDNVANELPEELATALSSLSEGIEDVRTKLEPLMAVPLSKLRAELSAVESAKLDLCMAYSLNSLYWMYLCAQGEVPKEHPVKAELDRIKEYMMRVKKAESPVESAVTDAPNSVLNKGAAKRFISAALAPNDRQDKGVKKKSKKSSKGKETLSSETPSKRGAKESHDQSNKKPKTKKSKKSKKSSA